MNTVEFGTRRTIVVIGIMLASLLGRIDGTIVNVALPTIQGNLGASFDEATGVIIGYLMANVVVIPLSPWLSGRFGRRQQFITAVAGFTLLSLACALSTNVVELVCFRVLQGAFAGGIDATSNALISSTFPPKQLGVAQTIYSLSAACAPPVGLFLGGILTDDLSWQWCFLINVPLGALAVAILLVMLRNPEVPVGYVHPKIDSVGIALLAVGPSLLVYFLSEGDRYDWFSDVNLLGAFAVGILATTLFVLWELYGTKNPIVDMRIFRFQRVAVGAVLVLGMAFAYLSTMVFLPQYAQEVLGYTPTQCGFLVLMRAIPIAIVVPIAGSIASSGKVPIRYIIFAGFTIMALANYWQGHVMTTTTDFAALTLPLAVSGIGNGMCFSPLFVAIIGGVPIVDRAKASAIISVTIQLGGAIATASLVSTLHIRSVFHQTVIAANATLSRGVVSAFVGHRGGLVALYGLIESQARAFSYADVALLIAVVSLMTAPVALFLGRPRTA